MGITNWFLGSSGASFSTGRYVLVYARTCTASPEFVSIWRRYYIDTLKLPPFSLTLLFAAFCCLRLLLIGLSVLFFLPWPWVFILNCSEEKNQCNKTAVPAPWTLTCMYIYIFCGKARYYSENMFYLCESFSGVSFWIWLSVIFFCVILSLQS